jgi:hypothetical protein
MRAKLVSESLHSFEKKSDPMKSMDIGKDSTYLKEKTIEKLQKQGIIFSRLDDTETKTKTLNNIFEIEKLISKLNNLNIKVLSVYESNVYIKPYKVIESNYVMFECVSEKDAKYLIEVVKKFTPKNHDNFRIDNDGEISLRVGDKINKWLDEIEENRKTYNII